MISNLKSAADFCPLCGYLIELPLVEDDVSCNRCDFSVGIVVI